MSISLYQVHRVLKLLESPYDPVLPPTESMKCSDQEMNQGTTVTGEESEANTLTDKSLNSAQVKQHLNSYFSKPPEWSLSLCVA